MFHFLVQSPPQELHNHPLAASVLTLQAQSKNTSTHEGEIPVDSTIAETIHKSNENVVNRRKEDTPSPSSNEAVRSSTAVITSDEDKTVLRRDDLENATAASKKQDFSNDERVPEFNCKQLKNRTSVSVLGLFHAREISSFAFIF